MKMSEETWTVGRIRPTEAVYRAASSCCATSSRARPPHGRRKALGGFSTTETEEISFRTPLSHKTRHKSMSRIQRFTCTQPCESLLTKSGLVSSLQCPRTQTSIPLHPSRLLWVLAVLVQAVAPYNPVTHAVLGGTSGSECLCSAEYTLTGACLDSECLRFFRSGVKLKSGTTYTFAFEISNPPSAQAFQVTIIEASGATFFAADAVVKHGAELYGVANGTDPLLAAVPIFSVKAVGQSTPVSSDRKSKEATMTLNLWAILIIFLLLTIFHPASQSKRPEHKSSRAFQIMILLLVSGFWCSTVRAASFTTKNISQSNPLAGRSNTITVTIVTDANLTAAESSKVTITGLSNAVASSPITLLDTGNDGEAIFWDGTTQGRGAWSSGTLTLTVYTGSTLLSGTTYSFAFAVTNPSSAQSAPAIGIAASGTASFAAASMTTPNSDLIGVTNGAKPLLIVVPTFSVKSIQQSTPVPGATNAMTVMLTANVNLQTGSTVTITGLTSTQTADSASLAVISTYSFLGTTGAWKQSSGRLVLTAASGGIMSGTFCVVTFNLTNPASAQSSPAVSVSATLANIVGSIAVAAMTKPGTPLNGVKKGADPLLITVPWTRSFGGCTFSVDLAGSLVRTGSCPTQGGVLDLSSRGITSVPTHAFQNMSQMT